MNRDTDNEQEAVQMYKSLCALKEGVDFMVNQLTRGITSRHPPLPAI